MSYKPQHAALTAGVILVAIVGSSSASAQPTTQSPASGVTPRIVRVDTLTHSTVPAFRGITEVHPEAGSTVVRYLPKGTRQVIEIDGKTSAPVERIWDRGVAYGERRGAVVMAARNDSLVVMHNSGEFTFSGSLLYQNMPQFGISGSGASWWAKIEAPGAIRPAGIRVAVNGKVTRTFADASGVRFVGDTVIFAARDSAGPRDAAVWRAYINGRPLPFTATTQPQLRVSVDGHVLSRAFVQGPYPYPSEIRLDGRLLHTAVVDSFWISPKGARWAVLTRGDSKTGKAAELIIDGQAIRALPQGAMVRNVFLAPSGKGYVVVLSAGQSLFALDHTGRTSPRYQGIDNVLFSGDGLRYAFAGTAAGGTALVVDGAESDQTVQMIRALVYNPVIKDFLAAAVDRDSLVLLSTKGRISAVPNGGEAFAGVLADSTEVLIGAGSALAWSEGRFPGAVERIWGSGSDALPWIRTTKGELFRGKSLVAKDAAALPFMGWPVTQSSNALVWVANGHTGNPSLIVNGTQVPLLEGKCRSMFGPRIEADRRISVLVQACDPKALYRYVIEY